MRKYSWLCLTMGLCLSVVGCGDSGSSGGSGGSGGAGTMVTVTGDVSVATLDGEPEPLEGATVAVMGTSNTTTTDADGLFSIMAPVGTVRFVATANGTWGEQVAAIVPADGLDGLDLEVIPDALVDAVASALDLQEPIDPAEGLVAVAFNDDVDDVQGGEAATISSLALGSFIFDAEGDPVLASVLVAGGGADVIYFNVDLADTVTATATSSTSAECPQAFPDASYSVQAKVLTEIEVVCPTQ